MNKRECPTCSGSGIKDGVTLSEIADSLEDILHSKYACPTCEGYGELFEEGDQNIS